MFYQLKIAEPSDSGRLIEFVKEAGSNADGIPERIDQFVLMTDGGEKISACIGLEVYEENGLLRSLVVSKDLDQAYILSLFRSVHEAGRKKNVKNYYLVAGGQASIDFLEAVGFKRVPEDRLPKGMLESEHVQTSLRRKGSAVMVKNA
ncbi:hypothetical protein GKZ89_11485 [Bacillus mangrovi]|uniref:N-acetyltransferase domain-containing protein n=1 Tax=Metabacillus mangrovi TaxID=1491830 RepID=A0A7X2V529_9BACI|nr:hypothetical protein [Metabacillus mangrovi]MTH54030.1 hypothetical protein [Metabacillus mangrovi]